MKRWRVSDFGAEIRELDVVKETAKCYWINTRWGVRRRDKGYSYSETWKETRDALVAKLEIRVEATKRRLAGDEAILAGVKTLVDPTGGE